MTNPIVKFVTIDDDQAGQRIDNFLLANLKGVPKSHVYRILRKGEVRVNKGRIKPVYRLQAGDIVRIPPVRVSEKPEEIAPGQRVLDALQASILFENDQFIIIDKPSGIAVHGGSGLSYGIIEGLRALKPDARYLELVHRLDKDTSGCLVIAKKRSFLRVIHEQFQSKQVKKQYLALVKGEWLDGERKIDAPLTKNNLQSGERIVRVNQDGKQAISLVKPRQCNKVASLVELMPLTGRTHQLRVHTAYVDHPIAGDEKYGDEVFNKLMKTSGLKRLFLHAHSIKFELSDGQKMLFTAPLPQALQDVLDKVFKGDEQ